MRATCGRERTSRLMCEAGKWSTKFRINPMNNSLKILATIEIPLSSNPKRWIKIIPNNAPHSSPDQIILNRFFSPPSRENQRVTHTQKSDPRWSLKWLGTPGCRTQTCVIGEWMRYLKKSRPKRKEKELTNRKVWRGWVGACDRPGRSEGCSCVRAWREESEPSF